MTDIWKDGARPMAFDTEAAAEAFIADSLRPFCSSLRTQVELREYGYRLDIGFRLKALPAVPLAIEVKQFGTETIKPLPEAIPQAWRYAQALGTTCFVGPFQAPTVSRFDWKTSPIGTAALVACHFSVGFAYFTKGTYNETRGVGGLMLGQNNVATFTYTEYGDPETQLHPNAVNLLACKTFDGSRATRKAVA